MEKQVAGVWSDLLGKQVLDARAEFFELGGDSLKSIQVSVKLSKIIGREVAISQVFRHTTVTSLAASLSENVSNSAKIIKLGGEVKWLDPVIVFIHDFTGWNQVFRDITPLLAATHECYAIDPASNWPGSGETIKELSESYRKVIEHHFSSRTIILVGYSFGCLVAHQLSKTLVTSIDTILIAPHQSTRAERS